MSEEELSGMGRREFLAGMGLGAAAIALAPKKFAPPVLRYSPNETVNFAGIGIGSQGGGDVDAVVARGGNLVALCDVDAKYAAHKFQQYPNAKKFTDYRVMLDKMGKDIDAVVIGTPDHTHAMITIEAMSRGKHVYCEKPLTHNVRDVRKVMAAATRYGVVTQLGNQGHSFDTIRQLCELVWAGAIGNVHTVLAGCGEFKDVYCQIRNLDKLSQHYDVPAGLDYDMWVGPEPFRPYTPFWVPWNWRGWMPFGTGAIGDWFCHVIDPSYWALHLTAPTTVRSETPGYNPATQGLTYPPATRVTFEFPAIQGRGPVTVIWHDGNTPIPAPAGFPADDEVPRTGGILVGDKGMLVHGSHGAGGVHLQPDTVRQQWSGKNAPTQTIPRVKGHHWDWLEAIKTGRKAGSDFAYGGRLTQVALLGAISLQFPGETLAWDDHAGHFTNNSAANAMLHPPIRKGWKV